ncbi:MAG: hypothetical protein HUJ31_07720, partial [Pseudomonadales bacterium]|nr:hypothetical protein [Pseudomonadales bacterium]
VHGGGGVIVVPMLVSAAVVLLLYRASALVWIRAALAGGLGIGLCLGKLVAVGYLMGEFPRDLYKLPGVDGLGASIYVVFRSLVWPLEEDALNALVVNRSFDIGAHELDYTVPVPVAILTAGAVWALWHFRRWPSGRALSVVALLALPVILNTWIPGLNSLLKSLPYFDAVTTLFRWNLIYILPFVILAGDCLQRIPRRRPALAAIAAMAVIAAAFLQDTSFRGKQEYDPAVVVKAWHEARRDSRPPPIDRVADSIVDGVRVAVVGSMDTLAEGASQLACNEPAFGYRLEAVRFYNVYEGGVRAVVDGARNFYRPECYVYPEVNACEPGDRFTDADRLEAFRHYQPIPFETPLLQRLANGINMVVAGVLLCYLGLAAVMRVARGVRGR